jgi:hypothetical protein
MCIMLSFWYVLSVFVLAYICYVTIQTKRYLEKGGESKVKDEGGARTADVLGVGV